MTAHPTVTAVVPTRHRPELLRAALAAIVGQDYPGRVEVVVVFDQCEPDESVTELTADVPGDRAIRVVRNGRTAGLAGARNTGILAATGELVAFCDDDDEWLPGKLARQVAALQAVPEAELASCGIQVNYGDHTVDRCLASDRVELTDLLRSRLTELHPSTFLFRRSALVDGIGLVDEEIPGSYAEDYELLLRAARRAPLVNLTSPYVLVRWHARSYFAARWQTIATALQWLLTRYPEFATQPRGHARVAGQIAFAEAASGQWRSAMRWTGRTLRHRVTEPRAYLALAVATRTISPDRVLAALHRRGKGI